MDPRYERLAENLCRYSISLTKEDRVYIETTDIPDEMTVALIRAARKCGAQVRTKTVHSVINRELQREATEPELKAAFKWDLAQMEETTAVCVIRGANNMFESSDVPAEKAKLRATLGRPYFNQITNRTKWVLLRWPTPAMAQAAKMSTEAFTDFYFNVCSLDYSKMIPGAKALAGLIKKTDRVRIVGPGETDLNFSIKGIGAKQCIGKNNVPDGEVYSAPVKTSVEGVIQYNTPTVYQGVSFANVRLEFKKGKIVKATCGNGDEKRLNAFLDTDEGGHYVGEFALGFNPHIQNPMCDILFDEKIAGSLHVTPGNCYETCPNGNKSSIHWDLVLIQRPEYGGGKVFFDSRLIRNAGLFVPRELQKLNPAALLK